MNKIQGITIGLALSATTNLTTNVTAFGITPHHNRNIFKASTASQKGVGRLSTGATTGLRRRGVHPTSKSPMLESIVNTHRIYPLGRDSREAFLVYGLETFVNAAIRSAEQSANSATFEQGTIEGHSHSLEALTHHDSDYHKGHTPNPLTLDLHAHQFHAQHHVSHHDAHAHIPTEVLRDIQIRSGSSVEGKNTTPSLFIPGSLAIVALVGASHGLSGLEHVLLNKLHYWPRTYQHAATINQSLGHFAHQLEANGTAQTLRRALTDMIKHSSVETIADVEDPNSFRRIKLNLKPILNGPTLSLTLSAEKGVEDEKGLLVKPQHKAFSVDVPGGSLTITLPDQPIENDQFGIGGPSSLPASLSFVEKNSGAELGLAKVNIPIVQRAN